ncbi:protein ILRUN-like [Sycon ciliatum]|uniref:protein ILRUN-like n=1 Tax=Sycon ciliatum TaxID=27933 RepID=UPI0020A9E02F|eukprot:scpid70637/ scgid23935/ Uncharacterized protein C6orf106 homolog
MDAQLLAQFSAMGTTDREVLVKDFQFYVGGNVDKQSCVFFLEMNSWNLQNAVGAYFEYQAKSESLPSMALLADMTVGEGESVAPEKLFTKLWRLRNNGISSWPEGCYLTFVRGDSIGPCTRVNMPPLGRNVMADVRISMLAPRDSGHYCSEWRMCMADGTFFGDTVWVIVQVADDGLLDLTQQMSSLTTSAEEEPPAVFASVTLVENAACDQSQAVSLMALQPTDLVGQLPTVDLSQVEQDLSAFNV